MQMTIRLPEDDKKRIDALVRKTGLKQSDIARLAIKHFLENLETENRDEERPADRAKDLIGAARSGISDLGSRHRFHLLNRIREHRS